LEHHNQMIDANNNQLNRSSMLLLENMSNMDEHIDRVLFMLEEFISIPDKLGEIFTDINKVQLKLMFFLGI